MMRSRLDVKRPAAAATVILAFGLAAPAWSQEGPRAAMDDRWHFAVTPYFWFTGLKGDVSMKGLPAVPVEISFSDIWDNLDIGILGRFEARRNRVGFWADTTYIKLGVDVAKDRPILGQLGLKADVRSMFSEGVVFYRVAGGGPGGGAWLDVIGGVRYVGTSSQLKGRLPDGTDNALPVFRKDDLASLQAADPPFGGLLACSPGELKRVFQSPGPIYDPESRTPDYWRWAPALRARAGSCRRRG